MSSLSKELKTFSQVGSKAHYNPDRPGKVEHIALDLKVDFDNEMLTGSSSITLSPLQNNLTTLDVDAVGMDIFKVLIDNNEVKFDYDGNKIFVYLNSPTIIDKPLTIKIDYKVEKPNIGLHFVHPTKEYPDKPYQIWTQGESEQSRHWYPCFDYPLQICTSEIRVELPSKFTTVSNGVLVSQAQDGDNRIDHWIQDQPHPNYLIALTAGEFYEIKDNYHGIEVNYYVQQKYAELLDLNSKDTPKMMAFFSQKFGVEYPWKKYSQTWLHDYIWGGMENTTTTFNTERALVDPKAAQDYDFGEILVAHELAHQWFGDYIVIDHWSHLWIKEGAATYSEYLWKEESKGQDEFNYYKLLETREYQDEDSSLYRRPIVTNFFKDAEDLYDRHSYSKGGLVYNMIRAELGDELFEKALKYFLTENKHKNVDSHTFLNAIEVATGKNLKPLFDQYVFRGGHPDYKINFNWDNDSRLGKLTITQKQADSDTDFEKLFSMKIPLKFGFIDKENSEVTYINTSLKIDKKEQSFYFPFESKPDFVSFDPNNNYLKSVDLDLSLVELSNQLKYDSDVVNRIYAAEAIAKKNNLEALKILSDGLVNDPFWGVRDEIASQIGQIKIDQAVEVLKKALNDSNSKVRRSVLDNLAKYPTVDTFELVYNIAKSGESSYFVERSAIIAVGKIAAKLKGEYPEKAINLCKEILETREGWNEIVRSGAISALSQLDFSREAVELILHYTLLGTSQSLKYVALGVLGKAADKQSKDVINTIIDTLSEAANDNYINSERAVLSSLSKINSRKVLPIINKIKQKTLYGRISNLATDTYKKAIQNLGPDKSINDIRNEIDQLKTDNQSLRSRLEELEAKNKQQTN